MESTGEKKRLLPVFILEVLRKYSSEEVKLTQTQIITAIKSDYDVECERKAIARNITYLQSVGYKIVHENRWDNYYYEDEQIFDDSELRLLIDSVLSSRYIRANYAKDLIVKLKNLGTVALKNRVGHIIKVDDFTRTDNANLFDNIDRIDEAIKNGYKVSFIYSKYDIDKKLKPFRDKPYEVSPYQLFFNNGQYYLACNMEPYQDISHFCVEFMTNIKVLENKLIKITTLPNYKNGFNLAEHIEASPYMYSGKIERVTMHLKNELISNIINKFGDDIIIEKISDEMVEVKVKAVINAMRYWALQYGTNIEVIAPKELVDMIKEDVTHMYDKYI